MCARKFLEVRPLCLDLLKVTVIHLCYTEHPHIMTTTYIYIPCVIIPIPKKLKNE